MSWNTDVLKNLTHSITNADYADVTLKRGEHFWKDGVLYGGVSDSNYVEDSMKHLLDTPVYYVNTQADYDKIASGNVPNGCQLVVFGCKETFTVNLDYINGVAYSIFFNDSKAVLNGRFQGNIYGSVQITGGYGDLTGCNFYGVHLFVDSSANIDMQVAYFYGCHIVTYTTGAFDNCYFYSCRIQSETSGSLPAFKSTSEFRNCDIAQRAGGVLSAVTATFNNCYLTCGDSNATVTNASVAFNADTINSCSIKIIINKATARNAVFVKCKNLNSTSVVLTRKASNVPADGYPIVLCDNAKGCSFSVDNIAAGLRFIECNLVCSKSSFYADAGTDGDLLVGNIVIGSDFSSNGSAKIKTTNTASDGKSVGNIYRNVSNVDFTSNNDIIY